MLLEFSKLPESELKEIKTGKWVRHIGLTFLGSLYIARVHRPMTPFFNLMSN